MQGKRKVLPSLQALRLRQEVTFSGQLAKPVAVQRCQSHLHRGPPREKSVTITFGVEFSKPPTVTAWLTRLDIDKNYNGRWIIEVSDITTTSCVITFKVWCNTYVYGTIVAYQAIG